MSSCSEDIKFVGSGELYIGDVEGPLIRIGKVNSAEVVSKTEYLPHVKSDGSYPAPDVVREKGVHNEFQVKVARFSKQSLEYLFSVVGEDKYPEPVAKQVTVSPGDFVYLDALNVQLTAITTVGNLPIASESYNFDSRSGLLEVLEDQSNSDTPIGVDTDVVLQYISGRYKSSGFLWKRSCFRLLLVGMNIADNKSPVVCDIKRAYPLMPATIPIVLTMESEFTMRFLILSNDGQESFRLLF